MPQIGWIEILLIVILTILIVGPKDFPVVLKKISTWIRSIKNYITKIQSEITDFESENIISNEKDKSNYETKDKKTEKELDVKNKK
tara:strand:+ start:796 stop:1053 length:258 start_codon:yes stop_codon:yes gene_type:complete